MHNGGRIEFREVTGMSKRLPYELKEAVVSVCGQAFWLKAPFRSFLLSCGVPPEMYDRFADESKYKIARHILEELENKGEEGLLMQRRIATELAKLRRVPDQNVLDMDAATAALRRLKKLAVDQRLIVKKERADASSRKGESERKAAERSARNIALHELHSRFCDMIKVNEDPQLRGYGLESLLKELFGVWEIDYRPPYRTPTEQIDGHFRFEGFDYLVEARWRKDQPSFADLATFKSKVEGKLASTRGFFVSMAGFRDETIVRLTTGATSSVLLMDGQDLALILEQLVSLPDALAAKIRKASQEGIVHFPLTRLRG